MSQNKHIFIYGFAIFAMFFGSGNLVFPIAIGYHANNSWFLAFLGLLITGIILPFLGLFVIKLHRGNYYNFFNEAGAVSKIILPFFTLSLLGSFGVIPRCITVAHGALNYLFPQLNLLCFSLFFSIVCFIFCLKEQVMIKNLGSWMSPLLLITLLILIGIGIINAPAISDKTVHYSAFATGFLTGYQTMDLFAAFFFSSLIFNLIQRSKIASDAATFSCAIKASIIGSTLLAIIYLGFVFLGSHYSFLLTKVTPELMLPAIVSYVMGNNATLFLSVVMILSCLTTAIALNNIYAKYICTTLKIEKKFIVVLFVTTFMSFIVSLLDFKGITAFLVPVLEASYPGIIFLTIISIFTKNYKRTKFYVFWGTTIMMSLYLLFS